MATTNVAIPELDRRGLRDFGLMTGTIIAVLFGLFFPWVLDLSFPVWPWVVFAVLGTWGLVLPTSLRPLYRGWMRFGLLLSRITTPVIMGTLFFLIIGPIAVLFRLFGRDAMHRRYDPSASSYWLDARHERDKESYFHQY